MGKWAGIGEKLIFLSGPYVLMVWICADVIISAQVSQSLLLNPPLPLDHLIFLWSSALSTMLFHASTGSACFCLASLHASRSGLRIYGYFTLTGLYTYHDAEIPL